MKNTKSILILAGLLTASASLYAASHAGAPMAANVDMTDAEVRKIDKENKKITLKHGEIKNLDMPGMTMVFQVKDVAMLDKVKFRAEQAGSAIVVTDIQPAK